ncbi:MAG: bifunctional oligoribonuclease/PAP phosphatase NrnA [Mariprofundaceae bacterium]|nr:bifunctional oligoribonuclease/PAP phosphatase NrnA [Mariprofundaceae bacterium]
MIDTPEGINWPSIDQALSQAKNIHLITHRLPDSDGIGSQIALYHGLRQRGQAVFMHNYDPVPRICRYLDGAELITHGKRDPAMHPDVVVSLDAGSFSRLHMPDSLRQSATLINIDHHASNTHFGAINAIDDRYCATGAMIFDLLAVMHTPLSPAIAQALYAAILTDTGSFRNNSVNADVYRMVATLMDAGADAALAAEHAYASHKFERFNLLKEALDTLCLSNNQRTAWMYLDASMFARTGCVVEDSEGFIDYARSIGIVDVTVMMCQLEQETWKITFRGKRGINVGALATTLGGGGHRYAAGCTLEGSNADVRARVQKAVTETLQGAIL